MESFLSIFNFIGGMFFSLIDTIKGLIDVFTGIWDTLAGFFTGLFDSLQIVDVILDIIASASSGLSTLSSLVDQSNGFVGTLLSFCAIDSLVSCLLTATSATFGVLLTLVTLLFVTILPLLLGWLLFKGTVRLIRLVSAGFIKP